MRYGISPKSALSALVVLLIALMSACSGESGSTPTPTATLGPGFEEITEDLSAESTDSVLFDIYLSYPVADSNGNNSRRDEIEVLAPDKTEYQGIFPSGDVHLLIVSCFADDCQEGDLQATFTVRYNRLTGNR